MADGYQVVAAKTAEEARVKARNHAPHLFVLSQLERAPEPSAEDLQGVEVVVLGFGSWQSAITEAGLGGG